MPKPVAETIPTRKHLQNLPAFDARGVASTHTRKLAGTYTHTRRLAVILFGTSCVERPKPFFDMARTSLLAKTDLQPLPRQVVEEMAKKLREVKAQQHKGAKELRKKKAKDKLEQRQAWVDEKNAKKDR